jgi:hypothetical protein
MNPDGMVLLLNYREDGVTREFIEILRRLTLTAGRTNSLLHYLEGWRQGTESLISASALPPSFGLSRVSMYVHFGVTHIAYGSFYPAVSFQCI